MTCPDGLLLKWEWQQSHFMFYFLNIPHLNVKVLQCQFVTENIRFNGIGAIVRYNQHSLVMKILRNMGSHFFLIQDVAKIDRIDYFIGNIKMKEPSVIF